MDDLDNDMFALSDEETLFPAGKANPIEDHLRGQLSDVQSRIDRVDNNIEEIQGETQRILKALHSRAVYGRDTSSDSDSDLYTLEGCPLIKKKRRKESRKLQILVVKNKWQRIVCDKWVLGVTLQNTSNQTLYNPRFYIDVKDEAVVQGISTFWHVADHAFWCRTNNIPPKAQNLAATVALDLPSFTQEFFAEADGTITYEIGEKLYQTPVQSVILSAEETIDGPYALKFSINVEQSLLAVKSLCFERTVVIELESSPGRGVRIMEFLSEKSFQEICADVYIVRAPGSLMHSLAEVLPTVDGDARLRISSRSIVQMNILLRLLRDEFPDIAVKEEDGNCVAAAMALMEELELHLSGANAAKIQRARMYTDLHIP